MPDSLWPYGLQPARPFCPWDYPGENTGVGCHTLLQGIFQSLGSNPLLLFLLHWQAGSLLLVPPTSGLNSKVEGGELVLPLWSDQNKQKLLFKRKNVILININKYSTASNLPSSNNDLISVFQNQEYIRNTCKKSDGVH